MKIKLYATFFFLLGYLSSLSVLGQDYTAVKSGPWHAATTWDQNEVPVAGNSDYILVPNGIEVTVTQDLTIDETVVDGGGVLVINPGIILEVNYGGFGSDIEIMPENDWDPENIIPAGLIKVNGTIKVNNGATIASTPDNLKFLDGSSYIHNYTSVNGDIPMADWGVGSTVYINGYTRNATSILSGPNNLNQDFYNFVWDTPALGTPYIDLKGALQTIKGDLIVKDTNGKIFTFSQEGTDPYSLTVDGNFIIGEETYQTRPYVYFSRSTPTVKLHVKGNFINYSGLTQVFNATGNFTLQIDGDFILAPTSSTVDFMANRSGGTPNFNFYLNGNMDLKGGTLAKSSTSGPVNIYFNKSGMQSYTSSVNVSSEINYIVKGTSELKLMGNSALQGTGTFTLEEGGKLMLGSTHTGGALQPAGTNAGNIQLSGIRSYGNNIRITYNGDGPQAIGEDYPDGKVSELIIANTANSTVSLTGDLSIPASKFLSIEQGSVHLADKTLTIDGNLSVAGAGKFSGTPASTLVLGGTNTLPAISFATGGQELGSLIINNSNTVELGSELTAASLQLNNADLNFSGQALTIAEKSGSHGLIPNAASILTINGSGAFGEIKFAGGATSIGALLLDRNNGTYNIDSPITINENLQLSQGALNNISGLTMANGATLTLEGGSTLSGNAPVAGGIYHVHYKNIGAAYRSGLEFPQTALGSLTIEGSGSELLLQQALTINQDLNIMAGSSLQAGEHPLDIKGNWNNAGSYLANNQVTFSGSQAQSIHGSTTFRELHMAGRLVYNEGNTSLRGALTFDGSAGTFDSDGQSNNKIFTLLSDADGDAYIATLASTSQLAGKMTIQRYIPNPNSRRIWRYMAVPVTGATVADWKAHFPVTGTFSDPSTGSGINSTSPSIYTYDETVAGEWENGWAAYPTSGLAKENRLVSGKGYIAFIRNQSNMVLNITGTPQKGPVTTTLTYTPSDAVIDDGFNLVGNPYPAPIFWDAVSRSAGVSNTIFVDNNAYNADGSNSFLYYSTGSGIGIPKEFSGKIAPGQAFYVQTSVNNSTITFNESAKTDRAKFYRQQEPTNYIRMSLSGPDQQQDEAAIRFMKDASDIFDMAYDARKLGTGSLEISSYSADSAKLAINVLANLSCEQTVGLHLNNTGAGSYELNFSALESFANPNFRLYLHDAYSGETVDVKTSSSYHFSISNEAASKDPKRFSLRFYGLSDQLVMPQAELIDNTVVLSNFSKGSVQWYKDGELIEGANSSSFSPAEAGSYYAVLSYKGCEEASNAVDFRLTALDPSALNSQLRLYPVPVEDLLKVALPGDNQQIEFITVRDLNGKLLISKKISTSGDLIELNVTNLQAGFYILILEGKGLLYRKEFIKQ